MHTGVDKTKTAPPFDWMERSR